MIFLDKSTDSILPYGLNGTPFSIVYEALQAVAGDVWAVDPAVYRAGIAWGYYLKHNPEKLIELAAGRQYIVNILLGEQIPLIKDTQTTAELVDLLTLWRDYSPTFPKLEALYKPYAADVDIRPITDPYAQSILPVSDIKNAFYVLVRDTDPARPLLLGEAALIAERATPMGSRPIVIGQVASNPIEVHADMAWGDICIYVDNFDLPDPPPVVPDTTPNGYIVVDSSGRIQHSVNLDDMFIHQIQHSVEVVNFYFTANGAAETEDSELESGVDATLYNADGTVADDALYDGAGTLTYTQANGNMFEAADGGDLIAMQSGALVMIPNTDYAALSVQVEGYEDYIDLIYLASTGNYPRQSSVTSGFSGTVDNTCTVQLFLDFDKTKLVPFDSDVRYEIGYYDATGGWYPDPYLSLSDLPSDTRPPSSTDANAQLPVNISGYLRVWEVTNATAQRMANITWNSWQIRAYSVKFNTTNLPRESAYFTSSGASGTSNTTIQPSTNAIVWYTLYDEYGNTIPYDNTKSYSFIRCFQYNGGGTPFCGEIRFRSYNGYLQMGEVGDSFTSEAFRIEYTVT